MEIELEQHGLENKKKVGFNENVNANEETELKIQDKQSKKDKAPPPRNDVRRKSHKQKIIGYLILLILHTIWVYIVKPLCVILEIVFLTTIVSIKAIEFQSELSMLLGESLQAVGWIILFILPLYNLFSIGIRIISLQENFFGKLYVTLLNIFEIIFNIPLTFLYETNLYSVYLYDEKGLNQLLSPWLIFFPTRYILSVFEVIRNFLDPAFFLAIGFQKLNEISKNQYQVYLIIILNIMLVFCILRLVGNIFIMIIKINKTIAWCKKKMDKKKEFD